MNLQSNLSQFSSLALSESSLNNIIGGKRVLAAARGIDPLIAKVEAKASRKITSTKTSFSFYFEGQSYKVSYDASSSMLHILDASGVEVCVEW